MQIKSAILTFALLSGLPIFLTSCDKEPFLEQGIKTQHGAYPRLVDVPDRPDHPSNEALKEMQNQLERNRSTAKRAAKT